jgi:hypothetical protein
MSVQLGVDPEAKAADVEIPDSVEVDDEKEEKNEELNLGGDDFDDFDFDDDATSPSEDNTKDEL